MVGDQGLIKLVQRAMRVGRHGGQCLDQELLIALRPLQAPRVAITEKGDLMPAGCLNVGD